MSVVGLLPLLADRQASDPWFLEVLRKHEVPIPLGQMVAEARSAGAPDEALVSARIWVASARRRGLVTVANGQGLAIATD